MTSSSQLSRFARGGRRVGALAAFCVALVLGLSGADAQANRKRTIEIRPPVVAAKIYKRPLLRSGRVQYCLKQLGRYEGRITGRMTPATARALRRLRDDLDFNGDDVAQDWALHALLWRQCRDEWSKAGGSLDRFGHAIHGAPPAASPVARVPAEQVRAPVTNVAAAVPRAPSQPKNGPASSICLPAELRDVLARAHGPSPDIGACELPCLPPLPDIDRDDAQAYEKRFGFAWCKACVPFGGDLLFDDIIRIEKAGNLTLCPDPRRLTRTRPPAVPGTLLMDDLRGTRGLFRRDVRPADSHSGVAVVIAVSDYARKTLTRPRAERDAAGFQVLLKERLGFRANRVIELTNPGLAELEDVFGRRNSIKGLLSDRLKEGGDAPVLIYFSGLGAIGGDDGEAYLLPAGALPNRERTNGYALSILYQNLTRMGAGQVTVILETDFASDHRSPIVSPNGPATREAVLPGTAQRGLTVLSATDRDQRPLDDAETGMSLFTRHLIQGLSGHADLAPIGNGDGSVDSAEAFVYAANRTAIAARKLSGVLQRPTLSQVKAVPLAKLGGPLR